MSLPRTFVPVIIVAALAQCQCGSDDGDQASAPGPSQFFCKSGDLVVSAEGVTFASLCEGASMRLLPRVRIAGVWKGGGDDGECLLESGGLRCPVGEAGSVLVEVSGAQANVRFEAVADATVEAISLEGTARVPGANAWLSNGFQSWSQTGVIALGSAPADDELGKALAARGDGEVDRYGNELSWWYTFAGGGGDLSLFAGATTATRLRPWVQIHQTDSEDLRVRLVAGGAGEKVAVAAGQSLSGESWYLELLGDLDSALERYGRALPSRRQSHAVQPLRGWNSWYELWDKVDEEAVRGNAALVKETFVHDPGEPLYVVVDDGWQQKWGEWEPNDKFPSGIDGLAADLKGEGLGVGVWLAPLLVQEDSTLVTDHPDWFVQDAVYDHSTDGVMKILDVTNPEAAEHLAGVITRLTSWGLDFLKIDFLFAGAFEGTRAKGVTGLEAYREAMRIMREAAGEETILVAVGAPPLPSFPYVDAWRVGGDIAFEPFGPSWYFVINQARSVAARWPLCLATLCDADPPLLRTLPENEVNVGVWTAVAAGGVLFLSDDLRKLPAERLHWQLTSEQQETVMHRDLRVPRQAYPAVRPETLTNSVIDQVARKSQHAIPYVWDGLGWSGTRQVTINFTDESLPEGFRPVPPHTAEEWYVPMNE